MHKNKNLRGICLIHMPYGCESQKRSIDAVFAVNTAAGDSNNSNRLIIYQVCAIDILCICIRSENCFPLD